MRVLNKLTLKHIKLNSKRSIVTIIGIALSTAMMLTIGTMFSSLSGSIKEDAILKNGDYHVAYRYIEEDRVDAVIQNKNVDEYFLGKMLAVVKDDYTTFTLNEADQKRLDQLTLLEGRLPSNTSELLVDSKYLKDNPNIKVGDKITFNAGKPYVAYNGQKEMLHYSSYLDNDANYFYSKMIGDYGYSGYELENVEVYEYELVGTYENYQDYQGSRPFYTFNENMSKDDLLIFIKYNNPKKIYEYRDETVKNNVDKELYLTSSSNPSFQYEIMPIYLTNTNTQLTAFYTGFGFDNIDFVFSAILVFILSILSVGCIIVIYNSFAISAIDRKREFGIYSSLGATPQQIKYSMYYESLILGSIGIILGMIISQIASITIIKLIIHYTRIFVEQAELNIFISLHMNVALYVIPIIFMIVVIFLSAYIPAKRSSKTSAMDLIRQTDDIKLTGRKIKTNFLVRKVFKAEGVLAHKNMKRNKKRYRITLISLMSSVVMFVSFSMFSEMFNLSMTFDPVEAYDVYIHIGGGIDRIDETENNLKPVVKDLDYILSSQVYFDLDISNNITDEYIDYFTNDEMDASFISNVGASMIAVSDKQFEEIKANKGIETADYIVINEMNMYGIRNSNFNAFKFPVIKEEVDKLKVNVMINEVEKDLVLNNLYYTNEVSLLGYSFGEVNSASVTIITNKSKQNEFISEYGNNSQETYSTFNHWNTNMKVMTDSPQEFLDEIDSLNLDNIYAYSPAIEMQMMNNMITLVRILIYTFIAVTALIGVTSVFNTVYTSIYLRRREFAMLRSVGMDRSGFNRILIYESLLFSLKTILYSAPLCAVSILIFNMIISDVVSLNSLLIPWSAIFTSIIAVFIVMLLVSLYSSKNIKEENILEALRKELN